MQDSRTPRLVEHFWVPILGPLARTNFLSALCGLPIKSGISALFSNQTLVQKTKVPFPGFSRSFCSLEGPSAISNPHQVTLPQKESGKRSLAKK